MGRQAEGRVREAHGSQATCPASLDQPHQDRPGGCGMQLSTEHSVSKPCKNGYREKLAGGFTVIELIAARSARLCTPSRVKYDIVYVVKSYSVGGSGFVQNVLTFFKNFRFFPRATIFFKSVNFPINLRLTRSFSTKSAQKILRYGEDQSS